MKAIYFPDTDTLLMEFSDAAIEETRDLSPTALGEFDEHGRLVSLTLEGASQYVDLERLTYKRDVSNGGKDNVIVIFEQSDVDRPVHKGPSQSTREASPQRKLPV